MWHQLRCSRLTANTSSCTNLVKKLLYQPNVVTPSMEYGLRNEYVAIKRFERDSGLSVTKFGLFVDLENGFLGAIIEVKYVPSAIPQGLMTTANENKGFFLEVMSENEMRLSRSHNCSYQIQGTLNITGRPVCYLVVMTDKNESL
ncbi:hypothetical protein PR048_012176 [Dryococelus australis]|uniref:Uncharacterized protein n=1 Tax=Dryococelus australis TaxID=614101 RepID=A0ABQ9HP76_9NEOP|nr:hypothetical protein PR048_012176 [Dryococelus australis]